MEFFCQGGYFLLYTGGLHFRAIPQTTISPLLSMNLSTTSLPLSVISYMGGRI